MILVIIVKNDSRKCLYLRVNRDVLLQILFPKKLCKIQWKNSTAFFRKSHSILLQKPQVFHRLYSSYFRKVYINQVSIWEHPWKLSFTSIKCRCLAMYLIAAANDFGGPHNQHSALLQATHDVFIVYSSRKRSFAPQMYWKHVTTMCKREVYLFKNCPFCSTGRDRTQIRIWPCHLHDIFDLHFLHKLELQNSCTGFF